MKINWKKQDFLLYFGWVVLLFSRTFLIINPILEKTLAYGGLFIIISYILLNKYKLKTLILLSLFLLLSYIVFRTSSVENPILLFVCLFAIDKDKLRVCMKSAFLIKIVQFIINIASIPPFYYITHNQKFYSSISTSNRVGLCFWGVVCSYFVFMGLEQKKIRVYNYVIIFVSSIIMYLFTGCKTSIIAVLLIFLFIYIYNNLDFVKTHYKIIIGCMLFLISILMVSVQFVGDDVIVNYGTIGSRLFLAKKYYDRFGITLFGTDVLYIGQFDIGYFSLLIEYGIIFFVIFMYLIFRMIKYLFQMKEKYILAVYVSMLLYFSMERTAFNVIDNCALLTISMLF